MAVRVELLREADIPACLEYTTTMCSIPAYPWRSRRCRWRSIASVRRRCCAPIPLSWRADCLHAHVGSLLLMHIERLVRAQGIANIISIITGSSERSCAFHEKNSFVLEGVRFYRKKI